MIQPNDPPLVPLPTHLSEEAAVEILAFLYEFTRAFEDYYANEIGRYPDLDPFPDTDPYHELENEDDDGPPF
jgi:hypothetical protein